jgi:DNA-binding NarL/FixJ family response regulator
MIRAQVLTAVLELAKDGLPISEIAEKLVIQDGSVRNQLSNIYRILRVKNRVELFQERFNLH